MGYCSAQGGQLRRTSLREELAAQPLPETMHIVQMMLKNDSSSEDEVKI